MIAVSVTRLWPNTLTTNTAHKEKPSEFAFL